MALTVTVSVEDPEPPVIEAGLKTPVGPVGDAVMLKSTVPVYPPEGATVTV